MNMVDKRGRWLAWTVVGAVAMMVGSSSAQAGGGLYAWVTGHHTIPRETLAKDYRTGDVMMAPPIPYGEYTKDYAGALHGVIGKVCGACGGLGCGLCGGKGMTHGDACNNCGGSGHGQNGNPCGGCGGSGLLSKHGHGHGAGGLCGACGDGGGAIIASSGHGLKNGHGLFGGHKHHKGAAVVMASEQSIASPQAFPSPQGLACDSCHGKGKKFGGACGLCGGLGSKLCGGCGGLGKLGHGDACNSCGGCGLLSCLKGGKGHGHGMGNPCGHCGGAGCGACGGGGLLDHDGKAVHHFKGIGAHLGYKLGHGGVEYFVGPGGPVPITPGYVPYINPVRSPRDFFAFPPFSENAGVGQMDP